MVGKLQPPLGSLLCLCRGDRLEKNPGLRPLEVDGTFQQMATKYVLAEAGPEAMHTFRIDRLCSGIEMVIEG